MTTNRLIRALPLAVAFAVILGGAGSFITSPWTAGELSWTVVQPIVAGAVVGFAFGLAASEWRRLGWLAWLLTLPGMGLLVWWGIRRCEATTPGDDCGIAGLIFFFWIAPWAIGIAVLAIWTVVLRRLPTIP